MSPLQHSCEVPIPTASSGRYAGIAAELTSHPGMWEGDAGARVWLGFCYIGASGSINGCTLRMCLCGFGQVMADLIQSRGKASRHGACRSLRKIGAEQNPLYPPEVRLYPSLSLSLCLPARGNNYPSSVPVGKAGVSKVSACSVSRAFAA